MRNPVLYAGVVPELCRLGLGGILCVSGVLKLLDPGPAAEFLAAITKHDLATVAPIVALGELVLGVLLLCRVRLKLMSRLALALSASFLTVHAFTMTLPQPPPPCGCFGQSLTVAVDESSEHAAALWIALSAGLGFAALVVLIRAHKETLSHARSDDGSPTF